MGADAPNVVVGPGVEIQNLGSSIIEQTPVIVDIDFSDQQIIITAVNDQPLSFEEALLFSVLGEDAPRVTGVSINPATTWAGFDTNLRLFTAAQNISVNLAGLTASSGQQLVIDVVPEPAAGALMLVASAPLAAARRRWKRLQ